MELETTEAGLRRHSSFVGPAVPDSGGTGLRRRGTGGSRLDFLLRPRDEIRHRHLPLIPLRPMPNRHHPRLLLFFTENQHIGDLVYAGLANLRADLFWAE